MADEPVGNMIYGRLEHLNGEGSWLPQPIVTALEYLRACDFSRMTNQKYEIDGENIFMMINEYETKAVAGKKAEQHRGYIDLHYIILGQEMIGWGVDDQAHEVIDAYDPVKERTSYRTVVDEVYIPLLAGTAVLFFPHDIHRPELDFGGKHTVRKAVIKIKASICQ